MRKTLLTYGRCEELFKKARYCSTIREKATRLENNTYLIKHDDRYSVLLYNTEIVDIYPDKWTFYAGRWTTQLTRERMEKYAPIYIMQKKWIWYYTPILGEEQVKFTDGCVITKDDLFMAELIRGAL